MQNDTSSNMADKVVDVVRRVMGECSSDFCIDDVNEDVNYKYFTVVFKAYEFFWIGITYDRGSMTAYIRCGEGNIIFENLLDWWEKIDLHNWIKEVDTEIRLRIPDKYLVAKRYVRQRRNEGLVL